MVRNALLTWELSDPAFSWSNPASEITGQPHASGALTLPISDESAPLVSPVVVIPPSPSGAKRMLLRLQSKRSDGAYVIFNADPELPEPGGYTEDTSQPVSFLDAVPFVVVDPMLPRLIVVQGGDRFCALGVAAWGAGQKP